MSRIGTSIETESRLVVARGWGEDGMGHNWAWVFFWGDENALELDGGDVNMLKATELYTWNLVSMLKAIELYTWKGGILYYVNYISILEKKVPAWF